MRRWGRARSDDTEVALANFALTFAKALLVLCVVLIVMITDDQKKDDGVKPKAEVLIIVNWPKEAKTDIDTWIRTPSGQIVMYQNKEAGTVFLDRDDMGDACVMTCEEITTLRGMSAGEYVLNLNVYFAMLVPEGAALKQPLTVTIKIVRLNPSVVTAWQGKIVMTRSKEEQHVVRFAIADGSLGDFDDSRPIKLQKRAGE